MLTLGAERREQTFETYAQDATRFAPTELGTYGERLVESEFAQVHFPIVRRENALSGIEALNLTLGVRREHYSDFGSTSAESGVITWEPHNGLRLRASYSESFRPPGLMDLDESSNAYQFLALYDESTQSVSPVLVWIGRSRDLSEETARTWTASMALAPQALEGVELALTYFDVVFKNRLSQPVFAADFLSNPAYAGLVTRNPSQEYRDEICSRAPVAGSVIRCGEIPVAAVVDVRVRNGASMTTNGIDLIARYPLESKWGLFSFALNGTYIFEFSESRFEGLPLRNLVSTPSYPVDLRLRGKAGWQQGAFDFSAHVSYVNSYQDTASTPRRHVTSWTTVDLSASYDVGWGGAGTFLEGTAISLGIDNVLDQEPPFLNNPVGIGYDQENADLTGRIVSVTIRKRW